MSAILGINKRNADYVLKYNKRKYFPLVDDKLRTKELALAAGLSVPDLYGVVSVVSQVRYLPEFLARQQDFVVKPACGSGGEGIIVISGKMNKQFRKINGTLISDEALKYHVLNILSGMFSLGGQADKALIEYRVMFDPVFEKVSYLGVPDVRLIVFLGVPVMAMLRLPTMQSDGKANLHQGAIGVGVGLSTGITLGGVWGNSCVDVHPDTGVSISGIEIPHWSQILDLAAQSYELTGLGYQGVDIVIDEERGPLILELNARPGLNIQIANREGLLKRLQMVEAANLSIATPEERIAFSLKHFNVS